MATVLIEDRFFSTQFEGTRIAGESARSADPERPSVRWAELEVYKLDSGDYLIHRIGMSRVYHQPDTECSTASGQPSGDPATRADIPDDAVSCDRCLPPWPEDLKPGEKIRFEFPRHTIDRCEDPAGVIERLTNMRNRKSGTRTSVISVPVQALLVQCMANDPEFAAAPKPVQKID